MPLPASSPSDEYRSRERDRQATVNRLEKKHHSLGNLRLLFVIATLVPAWLSLHRHSLSPWWLAIPIAAFVAASVRHSKILRERSLAELAVGFYRVGLARIEDRWIGNGQRELPPEAAASLYANDLDLFGPGSLFELLSQARTRMGERTLAQWLLAPASAPEIAERQRAIAELRGQLDLREDMAIAGSIGTKQKTGVHPEELAQWAEAPAQLPNPALRWIALALSVLALAGAIAWAETGFRSLFLLVLLIEAALAFSLKGSLRTIFAGTDQALKDLHLLSSLLGRLERQTFTAPRLQSLGRQLLSHSIPASQAIAQLRTIVGYIDSRDNLFLRLLDVPLLYSVQVAFAAESWRRTHGKAVRSWLVAIGEMEALLSLAAYSYEHPADPFPELLDPELPEGSSAFLSEELGHPLIPEAKCVRNSVHIRRGALLISGSNMSGKSTLLRAVGINTVLAMAGAPVRARRLQLTPLHVGASILVNDSLQQGSSRFYAEITRLRQICDLAARFPVLFLLDELLQGTNSRDRRVGAEAVIRELIGRGAIGLVSTHDLALTGMELAREGLLHNMHLEDTIEDRRMTFDFKLREGPVTRSNGVALMRLIGLNVEDHS